MKKRKPASRQGGCHPGCGDFVDARREALGAGVKILTARDRPRPRGSGRSLGAVETSLAPPDLPASSVSAPADEGPRWHPVHTVYGGAQRYGHDVVARVGRHAQALLESLARTPTELRALPFAFEQEPDETTLDRIHRALLEKLRREPVEDYRVDFEDGFGPRTDAEEDRFVVEAAAAMARSRAEGTLPRGVGLRVKALTGETAARSVRTLDGFLTALARSGDGSPVPGLVVTLPKVSRRSEVASLADLLSRLERALGWPDGSVGVELMVETPRSLVGDDGSVALPGLVRAAEGRCTAVHLGAWDLTAALGVGASQQTLLHPYCDVARALMLMSLAGTGVRAVDGATNVMPVEVHRGSALTEAQRAENRSTVLRALGVMTRHWAHATAMGVHQGWDLHPGQVMWRHALVIAHARSGFAATARRLRGFIDQAGQAVRAGAVFDDAATGQGMLNDVLRAADSGAVTEDEVMQALGVSMDALRTRSFAAIVAR